MFTFTQRWKQHFKCQNKGDFKKICDDVTRICSSVISTNPKYYVKTTVSDWKNTCHFIFPSLAQIKYSNSENS